jgi:hypothetical protein
LLAFNPEYRAAKYRRLDRRPIWQYVMAVLPDEAPAAANSAATSAGLLNTWSFASE